LLADRLFTSFIVEARAGAGGPAVSRAVPIRVD
jgi:hypothetical protein